MICNLQHNFFSGSLGDTSRFLTARIINKVLTTTSIGVILIDGLLNSNGDTIHNNSILNTKQNYFHKPQYSLRHFWVVNDKFYISNISYASIGNGGGTGISGNTNNYDD